MFDPFSLLAAFAPVLVDAGKAVVQKYIAPERAKPLTVGEQVELERAEVERLRVLSEMDKAGDCSRWVNDVRAMMRPFVAVSVTLGYLYAPEKVDAFLVSCVWFYLFGERTLRK